MALANAAEPLAFNRDIRPILSDKCFACHGPDKAARKAELRLDRREIALESGAIVPGAPERSQLIERIESMSLEERMPPAKSHKELTREEKERLRRWIAEGAEYQPHWSFIPIPDRVPIPNPEDGQAWIRSPIDAFVLDRSRPEGLTPAEPAPREKWLRRVSFDLTGLPPTLDELDAFLADGTPEAFENAVDRLLASPAFGEKMANEWLDLARYADTFGYQSDRDMHVWPWRDWVIRAFNENLPYDQFILWQTAGDLLPNATRDQILATAFNRLHRQTNEGGSIEEEFRVAYVADRVTTNGSAFLGLTFECARCHDHKFDPLPQTDFYKFSAFFSNIDEHGLYSHFTETAPTPTRLLYEGDQETQHVQSLEEVRRLETSLAEERARAEARFIAWNASSPAIATPQATASFTFDDSPAVGENSLVPGKSGQAIEFKGEEAFVLKGAGSFGRDTPFSLSLWIKPKKLASRVVLWHQSVAAEDAAFRGLSLVLDEGRVAFSLVHFWPGDALRVVSLAKIPVNEWTHLAVSYDGSSRAAGTKVYIQGALSPTETIRDGLTRDFRYRAEWGDSNSGGVEMALGARFRDVGFDSGAIDEAQVYDRALSAIEIALVGGFAPSTSDTDRREFYLANVDAEARMAQATLREARARENERITPVRQIMVMKEQPIRRVTRVLKRGAYDAPGEVVEPDVPSAIWPLPPEYPRDRLGLAKWMIDSRNPLTARVAANRFWQMLFGRGLTPTSEDFGAQGQPPSHPELLDWLARDFIERGWRVKEFLRSIVLSSTYRQSSVPRRPEDYVTDPDNRWLARGPRHRLAAEQIRDNALAVSGLLTRRLGGPSVKPYQPAGVWEEAGTGKTYQPSTGEDLYRRALYTFWRRTSPPPNMTTFDAVSREICVARRERTATPLQSLVLSNDPQFVEAARVLAEKLLLARRGTESSPGGPGAKPVDQTKIAFRWLTSRWPTEPEARILERMFERQRARFAGAPAEAEALLKVGEAPRDVTIDLADHAALSVVVGALFNHDECVTKR